jgi:hypothetical protein
MVISVPHLIPEAHVLSKVGLELLLGSQKYSNNISPAKERAADLEKQVGTS